MAYDPEILGAGPRNPEMGSELGGAAFSDKFYALAERVRNASSTEELNEIRRIIGWTIEDESEAKEALAVFDELAAKRMEEL